MRRTELKSNEVRLDVSPTEFWGNSQTALFNVRVFDLIARQYSNQTLKQWNSFNKKEIMSLYCTSYRSKSRRLYTACIYGSWRNKR